MQLPQARRDLVLLLKSTCRQGQATLTEETDLLRKPRSASQGLRWVRHVPQRAHSLIQVAVMLCASPSSLALAQLLLFSQIELGQAAQVSDLRGQSLQQVPSKVPF